MRNKSKQILETVGRERFTKAVDEVKLDPRVGDPTRARQIVFARAGLINDRPKTLQVIADRFGITRERVRQIENKTLYSVLEKLIER